jgi:iron complex transport system permease protein
MLSLAVGDVHVPLGDVWDALRGSAGAGADAGVTSTIVNELRLPRAIDAIIAGAGLGIAGALLQGALANPLASPDVIGVSGGASFGAMLVLLAIPSAIGLLPVGALLFGLLAAALVFGVAWSAPGGGISRLILAGIAVTSMFSAGTMTLFTVFPDRVASAIYWMAGSLSSEGWDSTKAVAPYAVAGLIGAVLLIRPLDRLALGDDVAASLGARPRLIRLGAGAAAALLAASAAALAGMLTFVGLVVPHVVRMAGGTSRHGFVVPAAALAGAALVLIGDILARTLVNHHELPLSPFMVVLGVPLFLWLLRKAA